MFCVVSLLPLMFLNEIFLILLLKTLLSQYLHGGAPNMLAILLLQAFTFECFQCQVSCLSLLVIGTDLQKIMLDSCSLFMRLSPALN